MAASATPTDVVRRAYLKLYQKPITSLTDTNDPAAVAANIAYDDVRRSLLSNYHWNFATVRGSAPLVNEPPPNGTVPLKPPFDFLNYYQLPADLVRLLWVGFDWRRFDRIKYDINGSYLLLNPVDVPSDVNDGTPWNSVFIKYTTDFTDVSKMPPLFVEALVWRVAAELAPAVSGDIKSAVLATQAANAAIAEAQAINNSENQMIITDTDRVARARLITNDQFMVNVDPSSWGTVDDE